MKKIINSLPILIDDLSYGCLCVDEYGDILYANKMLCQMLEYKKEEILYKKIWKIDESINNVDELNEKFIEITNEPNSSIILKYKKKSGDVMLSKCLPTLYIDKNDKNLYLLIIKNIENIYSDRNILLNKDLEKYIQLGEMIEDILHQWKTPISLILTTTSGIKLKNELDSLSDEDYMLCIEYIEKSAKYLNSVINTFKCFFNNKNEKENFLMEEIFNNASFLLSSKLKNSNIELVMENYNKSIFSYKQLFIQIVLILMNNSIDAIDNTNNEKNYIFIDSFVKENKFYFLIKDNAGGINNEYLKKIFDYKFTTKGDKASGIGLYMIKTILNREFRNSSITCKNKNFIYKNKELRGLEFLISFDL